MKVMGEAPELRSKRLIVKERRIPYEARASWEQSAHRSRGSDAPPGRLEKPTTGRRGTGGETLSCHAVRERRSAEVELNVTCHFVTRSARNMRKLHPERGALAPSITALSFLP